MAVTGEVKGLRKSGGTYEVEVQLDLDGQQVPLTRQTTQADPGAAVEDVRKWLYRLGADMTEAFQYPSGLK
jgi:hypothetical protein